LSDNRFEPKISDLFWGQTSAAAHSRVPVLQVQSINQTALFMAGKRHRIILPTAISVLLQ